jgi:hypothetical protein
MENNNSLVEKQDLDVLNIRTHFSTYYSVSVPLIPDNENFYDIYCVLNQNDTCDYEIKYNPFGFGDDKSNFMYVSTGDDFYCPYKYFDEVQNFMDRKAIEKFKLVIDNAPTRLPKCFREQANKNVNSIREVSKDEKSIIKMLKKYKINPTKQLVTRIQKLKELTGSNFNIRILKDMIPNTPEEKMLIKQIKIDVRKMRSMTLEL